ncbi:hypothetical protein ACFPYJ_20095 [Paenibacillus solisilvae]|uniref:Uncharacterized protein n=1 Tax=Paenibacillus solisilvae TaxID=2486751 RepID=A0ABW0W4Q4_9BACL
MNGRKKSRLLQQKHAVTGFFCVQLAADYKSLRVQACSLGRQVMLLLSLQNQL